MNRSYYSDSTVDKFIKKSLCQGDETLYRYFQNEDVSKFRRRLQILQVSQKTLEQAIYSYITDSIRDLILEEVGYLTNYMQPMGDVIVSGGEAFNNYLNRKDRIITSDIDTKFVPMFKLSDGKIVSKKSKKFFEYLQISKLLLWDYLGKICKKVGPKVAERVEALGSTRLSKLLGISLPSKGPYVTRRYTLIKKSKQKSGSTVTEGDVLIDVELFALDLKLRYYSLDDNSIKTRNLGGILDIAIMRPGEIGYEVVFSRERGIMYTVNNKMKYNPNVLIASKKFLIEDLYLMQSLGLRPKKKDKDKKRMVVFSREVLGIKGVTMKDSIDDLFKKAIKEVDSKDVNTSERPVFNPKILGPRASRVNPYNYDNFTTPPDLEKLISYYFVGIRGRLGLPIKNFKETSGKYRFDMNTKKWIVNTDPFYIRNQFNYRPTKAFAKTYKPNYDNLRPSNVLYGYNPKRNKNIPREIIYRSSMIPITGLKNTNLE